MAVQTHRTFCRFCHANCAMLADVEDGKVVAVRGDPEDPVYGGYTCLKGRELPDSHNAAHRLHHSLVRRDGEFVETAMGEAQPCAIPAIRVASAGSVGSFQSWRAAHCSSETGRCRKCRAISAGSTTSGDSGRVL